MEPKQWILLLVNCAALGIGATAGPLLVRFYFLHGGSRKWFSSWLQTAGFPILVLPLSISYRKNVHNSTKTRLTPKLCLACIGLGLLAGLIGYLYSWGVSYLPLSTSFLLLATQLAFNAVFAYILVSHKFSPFSINAVILLTMGPILLALHSASDRPQGITNLRYWVGFVVTTSAAALSGLTSPLIEFVFKKTGSTIVTYRLVMEMQLIMSFSATVFSTVGMVVNKDFQAIAREARASDVGEFNYYMVLVWTAICWQLSSVGVFGVIFLSSSLLSGLLNAVFIPVTEVLTVIFYHEKFSGEKGVAVAMALWGFASYLYGEYKASKLKVSNVKNGESASSDMNMTQNGESASRDMNMAQNGVSGGLREEEETALQLE